MTVHAGVGDPQRAYSQPLPPPEQCVAKPDKVYVCFYNSHGDATWAMQNLHSDNWLDPDRGSFPFGWGFLPLMVKMMPGMLQYYQETRLLNDCFWGPSSGAGYTYSWLWPDDLVTGYLCDSRRLLDQSGQNGCNMVNWFLRDWWREVEDDQEVARERGLVREPFYEKTDALAETWLKAPGRNRLPLYERLTAELSRVAQAEPEQRRLHLGKAGWTQLVSAEIENVAVDRDRFLNYFAGRTPPTAAGEADALFYVAFTVAWGLIRSALEAQGIYANQRNQCLADFLPGKG